MDMTIRDGHETHTTRLKERAHHRLTIARVLTDDAIADCEVIRDLLALLREPATPDETAWVIERDIAGRLHYWTGRVIQREAGGEPDRLGEWSERHEDARRFARKSDAACMLTWHCDDLGRVAEHMWASTAPSRAPATDARAALLAILTLVEPHSQAAHCVRAALALAAPVTAGAAPVYRCDDAYGCEWEGAELVPDPDGVLRCPACSSVAITEPASAAPDKRRKAYGELVELPYCPNCHEPSLGQAGCVRCGYSAPIGSASAAQEDTNG